MVGGDAVHVDGLLGDTAKEVASSDDDANFAAEGVDGGDFSGNFVDEDGVDAEVVRGSLHLLRLAIGQRREPRALVREEARDVMLRRPPPRADHRSAPRA